MTGTTTLEAFALVIVTAIVLALVQEGVRRLFSKPKEKPLPTASNSHITLGELDEYCKRKQDTCAVKAIVQMVEKSISEMRSEMKAEMAELRKLVMSIKE